MNFALLGCGFVADAYVRTQDRHPDVSIVGVCDRDPDRAKRLSAFGRTGIFRDLAEILASDQIDAVINLTNPRDHAATTRMCLEAGKHVYSEKPLGMSVAEALPLLELARAQRLTLATAPCSVLSPVAQTLWKAIADGFVGPVRMIYANFDDGMIAPYGQPWNWANDVGVPWPAKDEFEVGCTFEHGGYFLTWLCSFFGAVKSMTSFASTQIADKGIAVDGMAPDFTSGCLTFANNVVARVTCGLVAPRDKSITVIGDDGVLTVDNIRDDLGTVWYEPRKVSGWPAQKRRIKHKLRRLCSGILPLSLLARLEHDRRLALPLIGASESLAGSTDKRADFLRGPAELASAVRESRPCRLSAELGLHVVEIIHALQYPEPAHRVLETDLPPLQPLWKR